MAKPVVFGLCLIAAMCTSTASIRAADPSCNLSIQPAEITLRNRWDRVQLVVSSDFGKGQTRDLTDSCTIALEAPALAAISPRGVIVPRKNG